jgi:predicted O-methyltransferase YrrM
MSAIFHTYIRNPIRNFIAMNLFPFIYRVNTSSLLINTPVSRQLIEYFDGYQKQNTDPSRGGLGFGLIHYSLIRNSKPKRILCIGSRKGFVPAICALACQDNQYGTVDFVDAGYDSDNKDHFWGGMGLWKRIDQRKYFSIFSIHKHIHLYVMTTEEFISKYKWNYQYIYIDGDHSYQGAKKDYLFTWKRLETGGFMVFHDITPKFTQDHQQYGVWKLWKELSNKHTISFPLKGNGLGIIQKT